MGIAQLIDETIGADKFRASARDVRPQFGTDAVPLLGAELLPERTVAENFYKAQAVRMRRVIASNVDETSTAPLEKSLLTAEYTVQLANSAQGGKLEAKEITALMRAVGRGLTMAQAQSLLDFANNVALGSVLWKNELERWQAIVDARVVISGENAILEYIRYPKPAGHRVQLSTLWNDPTAKALDDLQAIKDTFAGKGKRLSRLIASTRMANRFLGNAQVQGSVGGIVVVSGAALGVTSSRIALSDVNAYLVRNGFPAIEINDAQYETATGTGLFLRNDVLVAIGTTGQDQNIVAPDNQTFYLPNTLGFYAIGTLPGQPEPGRLLQVEVNEQHPIGVAARCYQAGAPIIEDMNAIAVISETAFPA